MTRIKLPPRRFELHQHQPLVPALRSLARAREQWLCTGVTNLELRVRYYF